jgi:anaerobic magnesium-protoporphyrin IX monomethyl ester cyclase
MKIAFVQPDSFHAWEALNIGYLASYLKANGYDNLSFWSGFFDSDEDIIAGCREADIVGFSCTSPQMKHALHLAGQIKHDGNYIVFGGCHPSALPAETLAHEAVDAVVVGEGEKAFLDIVKGSRDRIVSRPRIENLDLLEFPDRKLVKQERNVQVAYKDTGERIASLQTTRGCPYHCVFCASHVVWARRLYYRSADNIVEEFQQVVRDLDIDFIKFADDTFGTKKSLALEFCEKMIRKGIKTPWGCNIRVDTADDELLLMMRRAGCREVWAGVESGSPRILKDMKKGITLEQVRRFYKRTKEMGFYRRAYYLIGMPNESMEDIDLTDKIVEETDPDFVGFSILAPYPGTDFYNPREHHDVDWAVVDTYGNPVTRTRYLSNDDLHHIQRRLADKYADKLVYRLKKIVGKKLKSGITI